MNRPCFICGHESLDKDGLCYFCRNQNKSSRGPKVSFCETHNILFHGDICPWCELKE